MPGMAAAAQRVAQSLHAQAQLEIQFLLAEFDENVLIAGAADDDIAALPSGSRGSASARTKRTLSPGEAGPFSRDRAWSTTAGQTKPPSEGPSGPEQDRHVAGEIDGADGIGVVVDVGGMQPGLAAIGARPGGLGADQADAGARGVVMHLIGRGEQRLDVRRPEEIRRAMRAVAHRELPVMREVRRIPALARRWAASRRGAACRPRATRHRYGRRNRPA